MGARMQEIHNLVKIKNPSLLLQLQKVGFDSGPHSNSSHKQQGGKEYKFVELMYCICARSSDDIIQHHITFRYNSMKHKLSVMGARLQEIHNLVKIKNPSLLLQLQKGNIMNSSSSGPHSNSSHKQQQGK
eukprot:gene38557-47615_t